jgi:hypothetical protein
MSADAQAPARPAPAYSDVGKALGTDYFLLRDQLSEQSSTTSSAPGASSTTSCCR